MNKTFKKIWNIFTNTLVILALALVMALVGVRLFGLQVFTVLSGSMEPTYHTGSLIYVKKVDPFALQAGDVITYLMDADTVATHRVMGIVPDEDDPGVIRFRTKGDANDVEDATLVHYANVVGTPVFTIPKLGFLVNYVQNPPGRYVAISVAALLLCLVFLPDIFEEDSNKEQKPAKDKSRRKKNEKGTAMEEKETVVVSDPAIVRTERESPLESAPSISNQAQKECAKPIKDKASPAVEMEKSPEVVSLPKPEPQEDAFDLESILAEFRFDD